MKAFRNKTLPEFRNFFQICRKSSKYLEAFQTEKLKRFTIFIV